MLANQLTITYDSASVTLTRVNQDNFMSTYFGEDGDQKFELSVRHQIPPRGTPGEFHTVKLDVQDYDPTSGEYLRTASAWISIKTFDGTQDSDMCENGANALTTLVDSSFITALVARES